jgi:hypothetical protein
MRHAILILVLLVCFIPKAKSQGGWELFELATRYLLSWEELTIQAEVKPSVTNSFYSFGARGGHTNPDGSFTGGMSFYYSQDKHHGIIPEGGKFTNYHIGAYFEKKFRITRNQRLYFSLPVTVAIGESIASTVLPTSHPTRSGFVYAEPELLINYGLTDDIQVHLGPGYRITSGSKTYGLNDQSLSGLSFQVGIRFGDFGSL